MMDWILIVFTVVASIAIIVKSIQYIKEGQVSGHYDGQRKDNHKQK